MTVAQKMDQLGIELKAIGFRFRRETQSWVHAESGLELRLVSGMCFRLGPDGRDADGCTIVQTRKKTDEEQIADILAKVQRTVGLCGDHDE